MADVFAALNEPFQEWYGALEDAAFASVGTALVVRSTPMGGEYTLIREGSEVTTSPVRPRFGEIRAVTHVPLSLYALARRPGPDDRSRRARLGDLARAALPAVETWPDEPERRAATDVLTACIERLDDPTSLRLDELGAFVASTKPAVDRLVCRAGEIQAGDCTDLLGRWRAELGPERWAQVIAVVGTAPAQHGPGTHGLIVRHALGGDPEADGRLVILVGLQDPALLRHRLGVVLANRDLAATWFSDPHRLESDLMTQPVADALENLDG